jgi:iron complex outermembrane recepter protein
LIFPNNQESNREYSFESRYNRSIGEKINYLAGVFLYDSEDAVREQRALNGLLAGKKFTQQVDQLTAWTQSDKSAAVFANIDYKPIEHLMLSAGLRYGFERKDFSDIPVGVCTGTPFVGCPSASYRSTKHWYDLSPRFVASYQMNSDHLVYASYSKGFRAGNYNGRATTVATATTPTSPESVTSYEVGTKNEFFDRRIRVNLTGFYQETVQVDFPDQPSVQELKNAASADVYGAELEASWLVTPELRLDASGGALQTHYNSFVGAPAGTNIGNLKFLYVPQYTEDIAGTYTVEVPQVEGKIEVRGAYHHQSASYTDVFNTPYFQQRAYGIVDASVTYIRDDWRISAFGRNLQNTEFATVILNNAFYFSGSGQLRTFGVEVGYQFGKPRR